MFGYLRLYKPEVKLGEWEAYNAVYCGLCRSLSKLGAPFRFALNFDFTFYAVLALSLKEDFCGLEFTRCPYKPLKKRRCVKSCDLLDDTAKLAVLLLCGKLRDNINDGDKSKILSHSALLCLKSKEKKIKAQMPNEWQAVQDYLKSQSECEKDGAKIDACCEPTARLLSDFFIRLSDDGEQKEALSRLGYVLGRWIYLLDAADDIEKDIKHNSFNPLADKSVKKAKENVEFSLNICISEAMDALYKLKLYHFSPIVHNIIDMGLKNVQNAILHSKDKKERKNALNGKSV